MKVIQATISNSSANNGWKNLNTIVQAALVALSKSAINSRCKTLEIINDKSNPVGSILYMTSDPTVTPTFSEPSRLLEASFEIKPAGTGPNQVSLLDKWVKLADAANALVAGTCTVIMEIG